MIRWAIIFSLLLVFGALRLPIEAALTEQHRSAYFHQARLGLDLREQIGQLGFLAALSGFRSLVADVVFIQAHVAWERTEWGRVLLLFREATTLQPRSVLFWDMAAWHMAWNASVAALHDPFQPNDALRRKAQREYFALGKDFLERGIKNNPDRPQLYESLARLYKEKLNNHAAAAKLFARAAALPRSRRSVTNASPPTSFPSRPGHEREAYEALHRLYDRGEQRAPADLAQARLKYSRTKARYSLG